MNQKFEAILGGHPESLSSPELLQFQAYCSARSLSLEDWMSVGKTLYRSKREQCQQWLEYVERRELSKPNFNDFMHQGAKINIYNALTGLALGRATTQSTTQETEKQLNEAKRFLNSSEKVRMAVDTSILLNRALLHYYGGQITKAYNFVSRTFEEINKTGQGQHFMVTTLLMLAQIQFIRKNYSKALELYKKALSMGRGVPTGARLAMAYCFFSLGKYEMARACFQRILALDPSCVQAYLGAGVVFEKQDNYAEYFRHLEMAYRVNPNHPLLLLHLSEHLLVKGEIQKVIKLASRALKQLESYPKLPKMQEGCRNDYQQLKARLNNILGQAEHINSNYTQAICHYSLAVGKGLIWNQIGLAQAYINPTAQNYLEAIKLVEEVYQSLEGKDARIVNDSYRLMAYLKSKVPPRKKDERGPQYYYAEALKFNRQDFQVKIEYTNILVETSKHKALRQMREAAKIHQASVGKSKPELLNNIAVLQIDTGDVQSAEAKLQQCVRILENQHPENEEDELKRESLLIISLFNLGICLEKQGHWHSARETYQKIISRNKYHLDSHCRMAHSYTQLGNYSKLAETFEQAESICSQVKNRLVRPERYCHSKAWLQHLTGSNALAKESLKMLGRNRDIYAQLMELCLNYENIMRKGVQLQQLKEFLRPNRNFCYKFCSQDHHATFAYMLFAIVLLIDRKITKAQGMEFFNELKQFGSDEIPSILFNMGVFLLRYEQHEHSNAVLGYFKDKTGQLTQSDQLMALNHLLQGNYSQSQTLTKRNMLRDPKNLRYRWQYAYTAERQALRYYETSKFTLQQVTHAITQLHNAMKMYNHFAKANMMEQLKWVTIPELKQRLRNVYMKIRSVAEERKFYINSYLDSYEKTLRQLEAVERHKQEQQRQAQEKQKNQEKEAELRKLLEQGEESEDEDERERKQGQKKRKRAIEVARMRQAEMSQAWNELKEQQKAAEAEKKTRTRNTTGVPKTKGRKQKKEQPPSEDELPPQMSESDQPSPEVESSHEDDEMMLSEDEGHRKKKDKKDKKKKKKKKKKERRYSSDRGDASPKYEGMESEGQERPAPQPEEKESDELRKYMIE